MPYPFRTDKIATYGDWDTWTQRGVTYRMFIAGFVAKTLGIAVPSDSNLRSAMTSAYVSHGRWVADCPEECGGALVVTPSDPFFFCTNCGSGWHRVVFPSRAKRRQIENVLMKRPLIGGQPKKRNWFTYESVATLKAQNKVAGII